VLASIAGGGALGSSARYGLSLVIHPGVGGFPWPTYWVNVSGSALLGFVLVALARRWPTSAYTRTFVAVGLLGAYTTFSTFAVEADLLIKDGHPTTAFAYMAASVAGGLAAAATGMTVAYRVPAGRAQ
jgi:CrcB protein